MRQHGRRRVQTCGLGLFSLKYISDAFEAYHAQLEREQGADPEDPDGHRAQGIFWAPAEARWARLQAQARQPIARPVMFLWAYCSVGGLN